jgi:transcriptional regulator with XRE-family HTH domain
MASRIKAARQERDWSQTRLIGELERVAARRGVTLPSRETLKSRVSRWENNHAKPDDFYRQLLREALGLDDRELGFEPDSDSAVVPAVDELLAALNASPTPDDTLLGALRAQTEAIRLQDRQYGAGALLEQMRGHVANIEQHLKHAVFETSRKPLAWQLADAAALAGWQALDLGALDQAWRFFETASAAAQQAGDVALFAFARMEQAHVLQELTKSAAAAQLAQSLWGQIGARVQPSMRCWLAAATAEMLAVGGDSPSSVAMLHSAESQVDALQGERPPYLVFNATHLDRWVGHTLALLGDSAAEQRLRQAEAEMDASFTRASASLGLDLATSLLRRGEREEANERIAQAELLARRVGSRRQLARAQRLRTAS